MSGGHAIKIVTKLSHSRRFRKLITVLMVAVLILGLLMAPIEKGATNSLIKNEADGLWFAVTTVTGVGYGDVVPVTAFGRIVASLLQVFGVLLFGSLVAFVSVEILRYQEDFNMRRVLERMDEIERQIGEVKKHLDYLVKK